MSRVQLALNVSDLDEAIDFYSKLFADPPAKREPGYANFAIAEPPLKLVLIEQRGRGAQGVDGALNHLGVEVDTTDEVAAADARLSGEGLATRPSRPGPPVASPSRTRSGSRTPTARPGRSTPCSPTPRPTTGIAGRRHRAAPRGADAGQRRAAESAMSDVRRSVAPAARRVPRQRLAGRPGHRLGHRRAAALAGHHRASSCSRTPRPPARACSPSS